MRQSNIERRVCVRAAARTGRKVYAELREIRGAIKALQARIDYVLTGLREYRKRGSRAREDETHSCPERPGPARRPGSGEARKIQKISKVLLDMRTVAHRLCAVAESSGR